jgi:multidrug efflux system outer membrane protein
MKRTKLYHITFVMISAMSIAGCRVMKPMPMPAIKPLPRQFTDTTRAGDTSLLPVKQFFGDPHLQALIDTALQNNTDLAMAWQRMITAQARAQARRRALLPSVDAVINGAADRYGDYTLNGVGNFDTNLSPNIDKRQQIPVSPTTDLFVGLRSNWEIDLWGKLRHQQKAAQAIFLATQKGRQLLITNLVATLAQGYYHLLELDMQWTIVHKNIALQETALTIVEAQKAGGRATELAVQQFAAQLYHTRAIQYDILQQKVQLENELNALAGRYPQVITRNTSMPLPVLPLLATGLPVSLLSRRPDIREAELHMQAAHENIQAARKAFLPSLVISPYMALNAFTPSLLLQAGSFSYGLLGSLTAPIFRQKQLRTDYLIAHAAGRETVYRYQQLLLDAYSEVTTNMSAVQNFQQAYTLKQKEVSALQDAVNTSRELYLTGYATYLEVITAQKNVLEAELQLAAQIKDIYVSHIKLYRSLGGGWQ